MFLVADFILSHTSRCNAWFLFVKSPQSLCFVSGSSSVRDRETLHEVYVHQLDTSKSFCLEMVCQQICSAHHVKLVGFLCDFESRS